MEAAIFKQDDQWMGSLEELCLLTDNDDETLCKVTHHPHSTINNPNVRTPQAGLDPQVTNLGILVTQHAENNLKLASYYLKCRKKTSRIVTPADITLSNVHKLREFHDWELAHKDVEPPELTSNWPRNIENLEEYFCGCLSVTGIPLVYIMRENPEVLPEADDPVKNYASMQDDLIACAPALTINQMPLWQHI